MFSTIKVHSPSSFSLASHRRRIKSSWTDYQSVIDDATGYKVHSISSSISYDKRLNFSCFKLLRVLDTISLRQLCYKANGIEGLFCLRYLAFFVAEHAYILAIAKSTEFNSLALSAEINTSLFTKKYLGVYRVESSQAKPDRLG